VSRIDLICFGYNPWSRMWKRNQQIVHGLAREPWVGEVLFVNPDVWLASLVTHPVDAMTSLPLSHWRMGWPRRVAPGITAVTPLHAPLESRWPGLRRVAETVPRRWLAARAGAPVAALVNRPIRPQEPIVRDVWEGAALKVFDWSDDFETFESTDRERAEVRAICDHYLRGCDVAFAINDALGERAGSLAPSVRVVRNGTDVEGFARAAAGLVRAPRSFERLARPLIGYTGYRVKDRLDLDLIDRLAESRPGWSFVFVGPRVGREPLEEILRRRSNVSVHGAIDYADLPGAVAAFDVCILPNRINRHTMGNDPIKLYDYLASGRPVVTTAVSGAEALGDAVAVAEAGAPFLEAIERALASDSGDARRRRLDVASANSWSARVAEFSSAMREALERKGLG